MDMTDEQRRWWFATHPEFSWNRAGSHRRKPQDQKPHPGRAQAEGIDAYVDQRLKYEADSRIRDLLKIMKQTLGTESLLHLGTDPKAQQEARDKRMNELSRQALEQPEPGLIPDPHTALDVILPARSMATTTPTQALRNALWRMARNAVVSNIKKSGKRPPRLPTKGTPERANIEAARRRGRNQKRSDELANINADGEGSGVWTKKELEEIKKTREFPLDTIWHHEPTVANRPELAGNPLAVRPIRGGRKGHLRDGHGGNWQNPYDPGGKAPWE